MRHHRNTLKRKHNKCCVVFLYTLRLLKRSCTKINTKKKKNRKFDEGLNYNNFSL